MNQSGLKRRRFIVASVALSGAAVAMPGILVHARAWAESGSRGALSRIGRLLYPHEALPDDVYLDVLDSALSSVATQEAFHSLLAAVEKSVGRGFMDASAEEQLAALKKQDSEPGFGAILAAVSGNLYNHPKTWKMLGYGGPSISFGGYLDHGAGDIDWLPEAKS